MILNRLLLTNRSFGSSMCKMENKFGKKVGEGGKECKRFVEYDVIWRKFVKEIIKNTSLKNKSG